MISRSRIAVLLLFCAFIGMRVIHIRADAPGDLDFSAGIFTDEMHNVHQVRSKLLFGSWSLDHYPSTAYSPIFAALQYAILSITGVGLAQIKILPILLSLLSLILVYRSFNAYFGNPYGWIAAMLLGFNYAFAMFNRLGLYENLVICLMCLTLFLWQRALTLKKSGLFFCVGFSAGCVFAGKTLYLFFVVAVLLALVFHFFQEMSRGGAKQLLLGISGLGVAGILWYGACYLPFKEGLSVLGSSWVRQNLGPKNLLEVFQVNPVLPLYLRFRILPVTLALALGFLMIFVCRVVKAPRRTDPVVMLIVLWFIGGTLFLGLLSYQPTRYYLPILPAAVLMAAVGIGRFGYRFDAADMDFNALRYYAVFFVGVFILFFYCIIPYLQRYSPRPGILFNLTEIPVPSWVFSGCIALIATLFTASLTGFQSLRRPVGKFSAVYIGVVFLVLAVGMGYSKHTRVRMDLTSPNEGYLQIFWAETEGNYSEDASRRIRIRQGRRTYDAVLPDLSSLRHLRIDPLESTGEVTLHGIVISQTGFQSIAWNPDNRFSGLKPIHDIPDLFFEEDGLRLISSGTDPHLAADITPVFNQGLLILFGIKCAVTAGIAAMLLIWARLRILPFLFSSQGSRTRKHLAWMTVGLILYVNGISYARWAKGPDYSIRDASRHVGDMVPADALIAGVGVMMATIENRIRHLHAPYWFENPKTLFQAYPITHLFVSPYAGYLNWYKIHYPKVMEHAHVLSTYRIGGRDFFLLKLNVPESKKETAFRYR